jgi:hypothetical protein
LLTVIGSHCRSDTNPRPPHTQNFTWTAQDDRKLAALRTWAEKQRGLGVDSNLKVISELECVNVS